MRFETSTGVSLHVDVFGDATAPPLLLIHGNGVSDPAKIAEMQAIAGKLKYALIVIASIPPLLAYPFVQKHFVKGMMIGSVKG